MRAGYARGARRRRGAGDPAHTHFEQLADDGARMPRGAVAGRGRRDRAGGVASDHVGKDAGARDEDAVVGDAQEVHDITDGAGAEGQGVEGGIRRVQLVEIGPGGEGDAVVVAAVEVADDVVVPEHGDEVVVAVVEERGVAGAHDVDAVVVAVGERVVAGPGVLDGAAGPGAAGSTGGARRVGGDGAGDGQSGRG